MIAEKLTYSDYKICRKRQSRIDPNNTITDTTMKCPSCKMERQEAKHGEIETCDNCGLFMRRFGNSLQCIQAKSLSEAKNYLPSPE